MNLRTVFDLYFENELSYSELQERIRDESETSEEAAEVIRIFDEVEAYYARGQKGVAT